MRSQLSPVWILLAALGGCTSGDEAPAVEENAVQGSEQNKVDSSGKVPVALAEVPAPVLEAVRTSRPDLELVEASSESRDGRNYYDVEGKLPDGSELELDLMKEGDKWHVVEIQRDIALAETPEPVRAELGRAENGFTPARIIESRQSDGVIIYEFYDAAPHGGEPRKMEVKLDGSKAELLTREWAH